MAFQQMKGLWITYMNAGQYADPRTREWLFLHGSPQCAVTATVLYLLFVILGPKYMTNRKPFQLSYVTFFYNIGCVILSSYTFFEVVLSTYDAGYFTGFKGCQPYNKETIKDARELRVAKVLWWYHISKLIEFMDTILMVIRKKNRQITFLHVYHHASMVHVTWILVMFLPGGHAWFAPCLNSLVHMVMYTYYALSIFPSLHKYLWWKKYLTKFQLMQFMCMLVHSVYSLMSECDFPIAGKYMLVWYMLSMIVLFSNFYIHAYIKSSSKPASSSASPPSSSAAASMATESAGLPPPMPTSQSAAIRNGVGNTYIKKHQNGISSNGLHVEYMENGKKRR